MATIIRPCFRLFRCFLFHVGRPEWGAIVADQRVIPGLTGLRFFAAAFVALAHYAGVARITLWGYPIETTAPLGMSLFFCLSGFIIHYVYAMDFRAAWGRSAVNFAVARFSRLYPLFAAFIFFGYIFYDPLKIAFKDPIVAFSYLTLTGTWWYWQSQEHILIQIPSGISWSIATEWFFYCAYAAVLYHISRIGSLRWCVGAIIALCLVTYGLLWAFYSTYERWEPIALAILPHAITVKADFNNSFFRWLFYVSPYFRIFEFIGGCLTCQVFFILRDRKAGNCIPELVFWAGALWVGVSFWLLAYMFSDAGNWMVSTSRIFAFFQFLHMNFLFAPGLFLIILGLSLNCVASRYFFSAATICYLGEISYSIYLGHLFVTPFAQVSLGVEHKKIGLVIDVFMACVIAVGLYSFIELPAKKILRGFFKRIRTSIAWSSPLSGPH